jgi:hypothetical protein
MIEHLATFDLVLEAIHWVDSFSRTDMHSMTGGYWRVRLSISEREGDGGGSFKVIHRWVVLEMKVQTVF